MRSKVHIGPYEFVEQIAQSDIAVSYGVHVPTRSGAVRLAALKILNPKISSTPRFQAALAEQANLAEQLNHPSLAQTFDCGVREGAPYLLLEYVDGAPLSALLQTQDIDASVAAHIVSELAVGVAHAHGRRDKAGKSLDIVHGDIRPRNVLISSAGAVKLVDFGLARARKLCGADPVPESMRDADLFAYADPEHAAGAAPSIAADVFSLSALLWSLLAGRPLFEGADYASTLASAQAGVITDIRTVRADVDPTLASIVMRGLRQGDDGERDLGTAQALRTGLSAWLRENDPSFGRHRVSDFFGGSLASTKNLQSSRPLTRREFTPEDPHSVIFTEAAGAEDLGMSVNIRDLFSGNMPNIGAASAPLAAPTRDSFKFERLDLEDVEELADDELLEDDEILDLSEDLDIVSSASIPSAPGAPPSAPGGPPSAPSAPFVAPSARPAASSAPPSAPRAPSAPLAPPAAPTAPPRAPSRGPAPAPTPMAPFSASNLAAALEAERTTVKDRSVGTTGSKRGSLPPTAPLGAPTEPRGYPPFTAEASKGSISLEAASQARFPTAGVSSPEQLADDAPGMNTGMLPEEGDLQTEVTAPNASLSALTASASPSLRTGGEDFGKLADDEFADGPSATRRPAVRGIEPTPSQIRRQAVRKADFDPNEIYEESAGFYNRERTGSHYDAFDQPPVKKSSPLIPLLILIVLGLGAYIAYSAFNGGNQSAAVATVAGLQVRSNPDRARIFIDDEDTGQTTPHTFADMPVGGSVRVRATLPGYQDSPSVTAQITAGALQEVSLELQAQQHSIRVSSIPEGAKVYVDGNEYGVTPTLVGPLEASPVHGVNISLQLDGHRPRAVQHTWKAGEVSSGLTLELEELPNAGRRRR